MYLTHRPTTLADLDACLPLIRNGFAFGPDDRPALLALWRHLLIGRVAESAVVEDHTRPEERRIVAFGLSVFVTDEFVQESITSLPPYQACHILERWRRGCPPLLNAAQIARANADGGLNVVVLHDGWEDAPNVSDREGVGYKIVEAFQAHHAGYRLKHFQHEVYGKQREVLESLGAHLETDYAAFLAHSPTPFDHHPYLMGMTAQILPPAFSYFHALFNALPPRFHFRRAEQEALQRALRGETDMEIAAGLFLSPWTIKKRWQAIYYRVGDVDSALLAGGDGGGHGEQRRRHLLTYLRLHPEELRPHHPPEAAGDRE